MKKLVLLVSMMVALAVPATSLAEPSTNANVNATSNKSASAPGQVKKAAAAAVTVSLRCDSGTVYADVSGLGAGTWYADWQSTPTGGNPSTTGVGVKQFTTSGGEDVSFPVASAVIFPDFPRTLTVTVWNDADPTTTFSATQTFTSC